MKRPITRRDFLWRTACRKKRAEKSSKRSLNNQIEELNNFNAITSHYVEREGKKRDWNWNWNPSREMMIKVVIQSFFTRVALNADAELIRPLVVASISFGQIQLACKAIRCLLGAARLIFRLSELGCK